MCRSSRTRAARWSAIRNATSRGRIVIEAAATATRTSTARRTWTRPARTGSPTIRAPSSSARATRPAAPGGAIRPSRGAGSRSPTTAAASTCRAGATASPPPVTAACRAQPAAAPPTRERSPVRPARRRSSPQALRWLQRRGVARHHASLRDGPLDAQGDRPGPGSRRPHRQHRTAAERQGRDRLARPEARRVRARRQRRQARVGHRARPPELDRLRQRRGAV